ncbi:predicted protein [Naegleria gruberi]|uniref:Predicted protein n=1 Tax=Naegleria gruberi TaxID=5762 RepID=D2W2E0_NAEGR|nr:uncharacterized protein NAEGRDRAFT_75555 [Naegleria gruberi]EFC36695.1 predicted protein [Naegleria gruberi]|eukprot:XP_002669439.1 predicted protein [Naegleria gruberi strain NEG-M]
MNNLNKTSLSSIANNNMNNMNNMNMNNNNNEMIEEEEYEEYYLPENYSDRCKLFESFNRFTLSWISKSMTVAPNVTQTALQHYLIKFQQSDVSSLRHFGYTFAVYLSTPIEHLQAVGSNILLKSDKRGFSILSQDQVSLTQSISVMSFSSGQANSLKLMLGKRSAESMIINQLSNLMKLYNNNNMNMNNTSNNMNMNNTSNNVKFYEQLSDTMKLATAFVLSENTLIISLLQWIVWLPVYIFTKESMDIAIYCWNWIASVKSNDFNIPLLSEISNAWQFTIQKGYGLFSGHHEKDEAVELAVQSNNQSNTTTNTSTNNNTTNNNTSNNQTNQFNQTNQTFNNVSEFKVYLNSNSNNIENKKDTYPHRIWINYLSERYQSGGLLNEAIVDIYLKMLLRSVENINRLSKSHSSLGTRFRLSNLSLQVSRSVIDLQFYDYIPNATILQHRTFAALLNWFTLHPTWYNPGSNHIVQDDLKVLADVKKRIKREQSELNRYQSININDSQIGLTNNTSSNAILDSDNISISGMSVRTSSRSVGFSIKAISSSQLLSSTNTDNQDFDTSISLHPHTTGTTNTTGASTTTWWWWWWWWQCY